MTLHQHHHHLTGLATGPNSQSRAFWSSFPRLFFFVPYLLQLLFCLLYLSSKVVKSSCSPSSVSQTSSPFHRSNPHTHVLGGSAVPPDHHSKSLHFSEQPWTFVAPFVWAPPFCLPSTSIFLSSSMISSILCDILLYSLFTSSYLLLFSMLSPCFLSSAPCSLSSLLLISASSFSLSKSACFFLSTFSFFSGSSSEQLHTRGASFQRHHPQNFSCFYFSPKCLALF